MSDPRPASDSRVETVFQILPGDANPHGTAFGGRIVAAVDTTAAMAAMRHCRKPVVTASMDEIHFVSPVKIGHAVILRAQVNAAFRTSMEVGVRVDSEDPLTGQRRHAATAYLTFVALGEDGKPTAVPPLLASADEETRRQSEAAARRAHRLETARKRRASP
jgi:acyl-CoA hydrolase